MHDDATTRPATTRFFPSPPAARERETPEPDPRLTHVYDDEFRVDLERIRFSPYFSRLSAVTQVIPQAGSGTVIHNRLTHSLKVSAVARSIAMGMRSLDPADLTTITALGGCDPVVVQAAAAAHDLGHPPFGHLGEQVLDRLARERLGLADGFEGNAQTLRILVRLDTCDASNAGLNLTAAVRAAVLKYPWTRGRWRTDAPAEPADALPRGVGTDRGIGAQKFSAYVLHAEEVERVRGAYPAVGPLQQTLECSVMDIADDIAYAVHDLDDFYRAGVLQRTTVAAEFDAWLADRAGAADLDDAELAATVRTPGRSLELIWRQTRAKDGWIADEDAFRAAVERVQADLVNGLLAVPYDGGGAADQAIAAFTHRWIDRLRGSICVEKAPHLRSGHVRLTQEAWHDVVVLKFVHSRFVLNRPDLAIYQRGQARVIETLVTGFSDWLDDEDDAGRAPRRLTDLVETATAEYEQVIAEGRLTPEQRTVEQRTVGQQTAGPRTPGQPTAGPRTVHGRGAIGRVRTASELGRARAVVDYVASLTDAQASSAASLISGGADRNWEDGRSL